jgi:hypothetical protein
MCFWEEWNNGTVNLELQLLVWNVIPVSSFPWIGLWVVKLIRNIPTHGHQIKALTCTICIPFVALFLICSCMIWCLYLLHHFNLPTKCCRLQSENLSGFEAIYKKCNNEDLQFCLGLMLLWGIEGWRLTGSVKKKVGLAHSCVCVWSGVS